MKSVEEAIQKINNDIVTDTKACNIIIRELMNQDRYVAFRHQKVYAEGYLTELGVSKWQIRGTGAKGSVFIYFTTEDIIELTKNAEETLVMFVIA